jgi:hypothetical protein
MLRGQQNGARADRKADEVSELAFGELNGEEAAERTVSASAAKTSTWHFLMDDSRQVRNGNSSRDSLGYTR